MNKLATFLCIFFLMSAYANAQTTVEVTITAGQLQTELADKEPSSISNLIINGTINKTDFDYIKTLYLTSLDFENTNIEAIDIYPVNEVPQGALQNKTAISSVKISNTATSIGESAFEGAFGLVEVFIPNGLNEIKTSAFKRTGLTAINLAYVTDIDESAFEGCTSLLLIDLSPNITNIGASAFKGCSSLKAVNEPISLELATYIGESIFENCSSLEEIRIPLGIPEILNYSFKGCTGLKTVEITNQVQTIGLSAFDGCSGLTSIEIPASVTLLEADAFARTSSLLTVSSLNPIPPIVDNDGAFTTATKNLGGLQVPQGSLALYQAAAVWKDFLTITEIVSTGLENGLDAKTAIHASIVNDGLYVAGIESRASVSLFDIAGHLLLNTSIVKDEVVDVTTLPAGVYVVEIVCDGCKTEQKLVKK